MCGIYGLKFKRPDRRTIPLVAALSVLMECRGRDSWGYINVTDKGMTVKKDVGTFSDNVPARTLRNATQLIAHTRAASTGAVTQKNAHPFRSGHIIGVHNGIVSNHEALLRKYDRKFEVDSQHIFAHLAENKPLDEIHGWGAICYLDLNDMEKIHITKWNGGTLAIAQVKAGDEVLGNVFASTGESLRAALGAAGFLRGVEQWNLENEKHYALTGVDLVKFQEDKFRFGFRTAPSSTATSTYGHRATAPDTTNASPSYSDSWRKSWDKPENDEEHESVRNAGNYRRGTCDGCMTTDTVVLLNNWGMEFCADCLREFRSFSQADKQTYVSLANLGAIRDYTSDRVPSPATFMAALRKEQSELIDYVASETEETDDSDDCTDQKCRKIHRMSQDPVHVGSDGTVWTEGRVTIREGGMQYQMRHDMTTGI